MTPRYWKVKKGWRWFARLWLWAAPRIIARFPIPRQRKGQLIIRSIYVPLEEEQR